MTALDDRPVALAVSPGVAARRAAGVRRGRELTPGELADITALGLDAEGATHAGDLTSYQANVLGIGNTKPWVDRAIDAAEAYRDGWCDPIPWSGGYDSELAGRQANAARGAE